ncbi:MAG: sodium:proton antiporter [Acidobacteria bacterium]|nr:sodium:proton antiporter [Acidobacteriota bacterium]
MIRKLIHVPLVAALWMMTGDYIVATGGTGGEAATHFVPPVWAVIPFIGILMSIAVFPLINAHWWEHNFGKISFLWIVIAYVLMYFSVPAGIHFLDAFGHDIFHVYLEEYVSFIILLGSLFVISGGILIKGSLSGKPVSNLVILAIGSVIASFIGTTGAAMLLIRPLIKSIHWRQHKMHIIIFFIFLVCNIGGSLTPIGDPPLFLGFLKGIPFEWTFQLTPMWAFAVVVLLAVFFMMDNYLMKKEPDVPHTEKKGIQIQGAYNFLLLLGVIGSVLYSGIFDHGPIHLHYGKLMIQNLVRDGAMIALAVVSMLITPRPVRRENNFNFFPIKEVAYLFIGIFTTMIPALMLLNARGGELGIDTAAKFFWVTGVLSSFLDNAPTYITFLETALGMLKLDIQQLLLDPVGVSFLKGISVGAVFMGANTYIGNGPNFMVKAIAEQEKIKMPSFFGYMMWSGIILLPLFVLVHLIFFH